MTGRLSTNYSELWRDGGVTRVQKHRALRLVERAVTAACADWGAEYVSGELIKGRHSRSGRSRVERSGTPRLVCGARGARKSHLANHAVVTCSRGHITPNPTQNRCVNINYIRLDYSRFNLIIYFLVEAA
jgi:hypothetical protein